MLVFLAGSNPWLLESIPLSAVYIAGPYGSFGGVICAFACTDGKFEKISVWKNTALVGGFKYFSFSPFAGEMIQFDEHIFQLG